MLARTAERRPDYADVVGPAWRLCASRSPVMIAVTARLNSVSDRSAALRRSRISACTGSLRISLPA